MKLIVGLGNPGTTYTNTRHNVGAEVVDRLASRHSLSIPRSQFHSRTHDGQIAGQRCMLIQPMTYMNRSGLAVGEAVRFYKIDPTVDLLVIVDEVALPVGQIRLRGEGGTGGHNGLGDIEQALATSAYPRLRIGVDPPGRVPQADYVLSGFTPKQKRVIEPTLDRACDAVECWLEHGIEQAMNNFNANPAAAPKTQPSTETDA